MRLQYITAANPLPDPINLCACFRKAAIKQNNKLVATSSANYVSRSADGLQVGGKLLQKIVARHMSAVVVHSLEAIVIDNCQRKYQTSAELAPDLVF
jgi:hypothetical protein